jgi:hypothetical protein
MGSGTAREVSEMPRELTKGGVVYLHADKDRSN